jgi:hypothetical protein
LSADMRERIRDLRDKAELLESSGEKHAVVDVSTLREMVTLHYGMLSALHVARRAMTNERYGKPRVGMESPCAVVDDVIRRAKSNDAL